jgi:hypothetical protein
MQRLGVLFVACLLVASSCGGTGTLDAEALKKEIESVSSVAAEGSLLARGVAEGGTTSSFARVHASELAAAAEEERKKLASARMAPGLEQRAKQAGELAGTVSELLARLEGEPGSREAAGVVRRRLDRAVQRADRLGKGS